MIERQDQLIHFLQKKVNEVSIDIPEEFTRLRTEYSWLTAASKPRHTVLVSFGPTSKESVHWLHVLAKVMGMKEGELWGLYHFIGKDAEPTVVETPDTPYAVYWIAQGGLKLFSMYITFRTARVALVKCVNELTDSLPMSEEDIIRYWDAVYAVTKSDKKTYELVLKDAGVRMAPIVKAMMTPMEDREDLAFPDKETFFERLEDAVREKKDS